MKSSHRVALCVSSILASGLALPALAQEAPLRRNYDANGVDLTSGSFMFPVTEGEIGSGVGQLSMVRYRYAGGPRDNLSGELRKVVSGGTTTVTLNFGAYSEKFILSGGAYVSVKANGATLVETTTDEEFTFTASDGTRIIYVSPLLMAFSGSFRPTNSTIAMPSGYCNSANAQGCGVPVSVKRPNQGLTTFTWDTPLYCTYDSELNPDVCVVNYRLIDIRNNAGYAMKLKWKSNTVTSGAPVASWYYRDALKLLDLSKAYCDPAAYDCASSVSTVSYATPSGGVEEFTDWRGGTWRFDGARESGSDAPGAHPTTSV